MTDHKPLPVQGYTSQPQWKVDAVNRNKQLEEELLRIAHPRQLGERAKLDGDAP